MFGRPLRLLPGTEPGPATALDAVEARLDAESPQLGAGLRATFALSNTSDFPLELLNPLDVLQWQLLDGAGAPLELPERVPNLRLHRPAGAEWKLDSAIPIAEVIQDGSAAEAAILDAPTLRLKGRLAVTFAFELPTGDYRLNATVTLIDAADPTGSRILRSDPLPISFERTP